MSHIETHDVVGMTCDHCARSVTRRGQRHRRRHRRPRRPDHRQVRVTAEQPLATAQLRDAVEEAGYTLATLSRRAPAETTPPPGRGTTTRERPRLPGRGVAGDRPPGIEHCPAEHRLGQRPDSANPQPCAATHAPTRSRHDHHRHRATTADAPPPADATQTTHARHRRHDLRLVRGPHREGAAQARRRRRRPGEPGHRGRLRHLRTRDRIQLDDLTGAVTKAGYTATPRRQPDAAGDTSGDAGAADRRGGRRRRGARPGAVAG